MLQTPLLVLRRRLLTLVTVAPRSETHIEVLPNPAFILDRLIDFREAFSEGRIFGDDPLQPILTDCEFSLQGPDTLLLSSRCCVTPGSGTGRRASLLCHF